MIKILRFRCINHFCVKESISLTDPYRENMISIVPYREKMTSIVKSKVEVQEQWEKKMKFYMKTYEDLFGITKLTEMQEKVREIQTQLQNVQEKRRNVQEEIFTVQRKLQEMQDILHKTSMGDDMYISVVTQVHELLKEQKHLQDVFSVYDQTEREQQTTLALAINISQDQERTYREKNKYLSLITGIVGGVLGLVGSSINNWRHRKDIKYFAVDIKDQMVDLKSSFEKLNLADGVLLNASPSNSVQTNELLSSIKSQHTILENNIKSLQSLISDGHVNVTENKAVPNGHLKDMLNEFETKVDSKLNKFTYVNLSLIGSCALIPILCILYISKNS